MLYVSLWCAMLPSIAVRCSLHEQILYQSRAAPQVFGRPRHEAVSPFLACDTAPRRGHMYLDSLSALLTFCLHSATSPSLVSKELGVEIPKADYGQLAMLADIVRCLATRAGWHLVSGLEVGHGTGIALLSV
jgi:hypothetical protein